MFIGMNCGGLQSLTFFSYKFICKQMKFNQNQQRYLFQNQFNWLQLILIKIKRFNFFDSFLSPNNRKHSNSSLLLISVLMPFDSKSFTYCSFGKKETDHFSRIGANSIVPSTSSSLGMFSTIVYPRSALDDANNYSPVFHSLVLSIIHSRIGLSIASSLFFLIVDTTFSKCPVNNNILSILVALDESIAFSKSRVSIALHAKAK